MVTVARPALGDGGARAGNDAMQQSLILRRLDEVIASLHGNEDPGTHGRGSCDLLLEHLGAARRNLLGCAQLEYDLNLEQSLSSIECIPSKDLRARVKQVLEALQHG